VSKFARSAVVAAAIMFALQGSSRAGLTTILDQIGPNPSSLQSGTAFTSQIFGAPFTRDNLAVIDNFSITSPGTTLTQVDAAILGTDGFTSGDFNDVTALHVEIYSSVAAAASSLTGDVYDFSAPKADITLTTPYGSDQYSALAQINVSVTLGVGTYYLAVIPALDYEDTGGRVPPRFLRKYTLSLGGSSVNWSQSACFIGFEVKKRCIEKRTSFWSPDDYETH
jgi:hypothetical protein